MSVFDRVTGWIFKRLDRVIDQAELDAEQRHAVAPITCACRAPRSARPGLSGYRQPAPDDVPPACGGLIPPIPPESLNIRDLDRKYERLMGVYQTLAPGQEATFGVYPRSLYFLPVAWAWSVIDLRENGSGRCWLVGAEISGIVQLGLHRGSGCHLDVSPLTISSEGIAHPCTLGVFGPCPLGLTLSLANPHDPFYGGPIGVDVTFWGTHFDQIVTVPGR